MKDTQLNGRPYTAPISAQADLGMAVEASQDEYVVAVRDPLRVIWRWLWVIVLAGVTVAGATVWYDLQQTPTYRTSAKLLVGQDMGEVSNSIRQGPAPGLMVDEKVTKTMASALSTRPVAEATIERLDFPMTPEGLVQKLNVKQVGETPFIDVSYEGSDPERTQQVANTVGEVFSELIAEQVSPNSGLVVVVWEEAALPVSPASPNPRRDGALGFALGCILGVGLAFLLLERLYSRRLRSPEEIEQSSGIPTFGVIPK